MDLLDVMSIGFGNEFDHIAQVTTLPEPGTWSDLIGSFNNLSKWYFGGCSENISVTTAKLGLKTGCIAAAGKDFESKGLKKYLKRQGIDIEGLIIRSEEISSHCILLFDADGNDIKINVPGTAIRDLNRFGPNPNLIERSKSLVFSAVDGEGYCLKAAQIGKKRNIPIYLASPLTKFDVETIRRWLSLADVWILNKFEINRVSQTIGFGDAWQFLKEGPSSIIVTNGKEGSDIYSVDCIEPIHVPAVPPKRLLCPIGCGDAFSGGVVTGLVKGYDITIASKIGATVASFKLEKIGTKIGLPTWSRMRERYRQNFKEVL